MSLQSRREYLLKIRDRYQRAGKPHKTRILDEFCQNCDYHRKHALRLLNAQPAGIRRRPGPKPKYPPAQMLEPLKRLWLASDQLCSKRLRAALADWVPFLNLTASLARQMKALSPATIDRLLRPVRSQYERKRRCGTKPGSLLKTQIPVRTSNADITQPGFIEADTVAHCGGSLSGEFIWTLTFSDIATGYTLCRAVWNKGHTAIREHLRELEAELPFELQAFDCDNGGEFLNHALVAHYRERPRPVAFTRSRPYHKNDNAHVEQKNWSVVRQLLGYDRLDCPEVLNQLNQLYRQEWTWHVNFFCPTLKLRCKQRVGARYVKKYEPAKTPYARLLDSPVVSARHKRQLKALRQGLNPFKLRARIQEQLKTIFRLTQEHRRLATAGGAS